MASAPGPPRGGQIGPLAPVRRHRRARPPAPCRWTSRSNGSGGVSPNEASARRGTASRTTCRCVAGTCCRAAAGIPSSPPGAPRAAGGRGASRHPAGPPRAAAPQRRRTPRFAVRRRAPNMLRTSASSRASTAGRRADPRVLLRHRRSAASSDRSPSDSFRHPLLDVGGRRPALFRASPQQRARARQPRSDGTDRTLQDAAAAA